MTEQTEESGVDPILEPDPNLTSIGADPVVAEDVVPVTPEPTVVMQNTTGWSLVQAGNWEVSIGPDGMIMLPRHLAPDEVADFLAAVSAAAAVGAENQAANQAAASAAPALASTLVIQESGQALPPGAVQLQPAGGASTPSTVNATKLDPADPTANDRPATLRPPAAT